MSNVQDVCERIQVKTWTELQAALSSGQPVDLCADLSADDADYPYQVPDKKENEMKVEEFLKRKKWKQHYMADRVVNTLGGKGVSQGLVSNWASKGFVVTSEGWVINPKATCRLIERHRPCNDGEAS